MAAAQTKLERPQARPNEAFEPLGIGVEALLMGHSFFASIAADGGGHLTMELPLETSLLSYRHQYGQRASLKIKLTTGVGLSINLKIQGSGFHCCFL
jgi:hypothetical protein